MIVVSDTSPLNYLILVNAIDVVPRVFTSVVTPSAVLAELEDTGAAPEVRRWAASPPAWLRVQEPKAIEDSLRLGKGETAAISLAVELRTREKDVRVLIDERDGRAAASRLGLGLVGTLAVLGQAGALGLLNLQEAIDRLRQTSFHARPQLYEEVLRLDRKRRKGS